MKKFDTKKYPIYASFLNQLAKDLTKFYYAKLDKPFKITNKMKGKGCLLYTSPSPRDISGSRMPSSA